MAARFRSLGWVSLPLSRVPPSLRLEVTQFRPRRGGCSRSQWASGKCQRGVCSARSGCDCSASQRCLAGELPPRLRPGRIGVQREDRFAHVADPVPAPTLHATDGHHAGDTSGPVEPAHQRRLAHSQRPGAFVQRGGVDVWSMPLINCQAWLGESHTFVEGHAAIKRTVASLQRSLRDAPHRRRWSLVDVQCL